MTTRALLAFSIGFAVAAAVTAQTAPSGRFLSATNPALVDIDGDGPDSADPGASPTAGKGTLMVAHPWEECSSGNPAARTLQLAGMGQWDTFTRNYGGRTATAQIEAFDGNRPTSWDFTESGPNGNKAGNLSFVDNDNNGYYEGFTAAQTQGGGFPGLALDFVATDVDDDSLPDYASVPWSATSAATMGIGNCGAVGQNTQIWVPLATDGDGDQTVILDVDNDGNPDPSYFFGPKLEFTIVGGPNALAIPTVGEWGLLALAGALCLLGIKGLRSRGVVPA